MPDLVPNPHEDDSVEYRAHEVMNKIGLLFDEADNVQIGAVHIIEIANAEFGDIC